MTSSDYRLGRTSWARCVFKIVLLGLFSFPSSLGGWPNRLVLLLDPIYVHRFNKAFYIFYPCPVFPKNDPWPGCREFKFFVSNISVPWESSTDRCGVSDGPLDGVPIFRDIWPLRRCPHPLCALWRSSSVEQRWSSDRVFQAQISSETGMFSLPLLGRDVRHARRSVKSFG